MKKFPLSASSARAFQVAAVAVGVLVWPCAMQVQAADPQVLYNPAEDSNGSFLKKWGCEVGELDHDGNKVIQMTYATNVEYPTVSFPPPEGPWSLTEYAGVEVDVTNPGENAVMVSLRVDNRKTAEVKGEPYNTESIRLKPGETKTLQVYFGKSFGYKPGYKLDPSMVSAIQVFVMKPKEPGTLLIDKVQTFGVAGDEPAGGTAK